MVVPRRAAIGRSSCTAVMSNRGIEAVRVLHGFLNLIDKHPNSVIEEACEVAHANDCYQLRSLRKLIEHRSSKQKSFDFLEEHPLIRNLSEYGDLVCVDFQKGKDLRKEIICQ